jgi:hypothetical protein
MRRTEVALQKAMALQAELATDPEQNKNLEQRTMRKLLQRAAVDEIVTACKSVRFLRHSWQYAVLSGQFAIGEDTQKVLTNIGHP